MEVVSYGNCFLTDADRVDKNETEIVVTLKHLSNFWRNLNILLINCEIELILIWSKSCALVDMTVIAAGNNNDPPASVAPTGLEFQIETKLYVPVVTLATENDKKLLEQLKSGFKRTGKWNKYRSQITIQSNNGNVNYLIDLSFTKVNRLFVLPFERIAGENNTTKDHRDSFSHYYVPNIEIKDLNVLSDGKSFFDLPVENKEEAYKKIMEMSKDNNNTTGNLLDFTYFKENYRLIVTDLSKQTNLKHPQQIYFIGKLEGKDHRATMFFIIEKSEETTFEFLQNSVNVL